MARKPRCPSCRTGLSHAIPHGTASGYDYHGCSCDACSAYKRAWSSAYRAKASIRVCSIADCGRPRYAKGLCSGHHRRVKRTGSVGTEPLIDWNECPEKRFWRNVDKTGDCWLWTAGTNVGGYGYIRVKGKTVLAHRFSWQLAGGEVPVGRFIDHRHTCPKSCVNPNHLRVVTTKQNMENRSGPQRNNVSGVRGVFRHDDGRWRVRVQHNGKQHHGGCFEELEDAEAAAVDLRNRLFTHNDADRATA